MLAFSSVREFIAENSGFLAQGDTWWFTSLPLQEFDPPRGRPAVIGRRIGGQPSDTL